MPKIHIPRAYRKYTGNVSVHESNKNTLTSLFEELTRNYPPLMGTVFSTNNFPLPFVRIVARDNLISVDEYSSTTLTSDETILLVNAVAGG